MTGYDRTRRVVRDLAHDHRFQQVIENKQLRCDTCGRVERLEAGDMSRYLRDGFPKCHGMTMWLEDATG